MIIDKMILNNNNKVTSLLPPLRSSSLLSPWSTSTPSAQPTWPTVSGSPAAAAGGR